VTVFTALLCRKLILASNYPDSAKDVPIIAHRLQKSIRNAWTALGAARPSIPQRDSSRSFDNARWHSARKR